MKKPTEKWDPVFKTERSFTPEKVKDIFKNSRIRDFKVKEIKDPEGLAARLNEILIDYHGFKHRGKEPAPAVGRGNLEDLRKLSKKYYETLKNLGFTAKTQLGFNDFDSLQHNVLGLQIKAEAAIKSIKTKSGRRKTSRATTIIKLSVIYKEVTDREPGRSNSKGKPSGPFFEFVKNCLKCIDPLDQIGDESVSKAIRGALNLREEYFKHEKSAL